MGKAKGGKVLMALGMVLALISGGIVFVVAQTATAGPVDIPKKPIVMAKTDINERTIITPELIQAVPMQEDLIPRGTVLKPEDVIGKYARQKIFAGTPIIDGQIAFTGKPNEPLLTTQPVTAPAVKPPPAPKIDAAFALEKGKTMIAVDYPTASKLIGSGLLKVGDKVDIYVQAPGINGDQIAQVYSSMEVKAIGEFNKSADGVVEPTSTLIFIVSPQDALVLKYIEKLNPLLLLRAAGDDQVLRTDLVTIDYITSRFGLQRTGAAR